MHREALWSIFIGVTIAIGAVAIWVLPFGPSPGQLMFVADVYVVPVLALVVSLLLAASIHRRRQRRG